MAQSVEFDLGFQFRNKYYRDAERGLRAFAEDLELSYDAFTPRARKIMRDYLTNVAEAMSRRHGAPWPGGTSSNTLSKRSGQLIESIRQSVRVDGQSLDKLAGHIGSEVPYAAIQEYGGVIKARNAKYLTIPLPPALNSDGTPKKRSAREWRNTFVQTSKKGNLLIFRRKGGGIEPLYLLKPEVRIPPRLGLGDTLEAGKSFFIESLMEGLRRAMTEAT